jgi:hypothetical protein
LRVFRLPALPPWSSVLPHLHPPRLRRQSCSLYPDSTSSTLAIAGNIGILPHCRSTHHDHLRAPLYWSSQTLASIHGGPYLRASGIGNTGVCIHPRRVLGSGKLSAHLIPDGLDTRHLHPRRILAPHHLAPLCAYGSCAASSTSANTTSTLLTSATPNTAFSTTATRPLSWLSRHRHKGLPLC